MSPLRLLSLALASSFAVGCGASTEPIVHDAGAPMDGAVRRDAGTDAGGPAACSSTADCIWGEIDREIVTARDCPCLYGCPGVALNRTTNTRRTAAYTTLCDPRRDGMGNPCGIDDCAMPPPIMCTGGVCSGPPAP